MVEPRFEDLLVERQALVTEQRRLQREHAELKRSPIDVEAHGAYARKLSAYMDRVYNFMLKVFEAGDQKHSEIRTMGQTDQRPQFPTGA